MDESLSFHKMSSSYDILNFYFEFVIILLLL